MEVEKKREGNFPMNAVRLCIDGYAKDLQGRIYSKLCSEPLLFDNCGEMLLRTDALFDLHGYPQTFQEKRSFIKEKQIQGRYAAPHETEDDETIWEQWGQCCTLDLIVLSRRRAGWQGMLLYPDKTVAANFQSEMELLENIWQILTNSKAASGR